MQKLPENLYLSQQVREMDRLAIEQKGMLGIDLMRKAGKAIFALIQRHYADHAVILFCGAGNNAGDAYVVATLARQAGYKVTVYHLSEPDKLKDEAQLAYQQFIQLGGVSVPFEAKNLIDCNSSVIIDGLLGTGINRDVSGVYAECIQWINHSIAEVIAIDIPSGLNADTGFVMGAAIKAHYTLSFIALKQGLFTGLAANYCGTVSYASLGVKNDVLDQFTPSSKRMIHCSIPRRQRCVHKGDNGHVLVIGGDEGFSGAVKLAAEAALRVGAGLVSIATRKSHAGYLNIARPELMCHGIEESADLIPLLNKASVIIIGPGLGQAQWGRDLFKQTMQANKPMVIDADALNLLVSSRQYKDNWVLTPHPGEAARLLHCSTLAIAKDRFKAVTTLQNKFGGVAVLKGAGTLIKNADEMTLSNSGNPGMASGGMGDVLAGMIAGLMAQKLELYIAATTAVYLHGKAADLSAQQAGEIGLLASDLMPFIRELVNNS